jgi:hypothetical protein
MVCELGAADFPFVWNAWLGPELLCVMTAIWPLRKTVSIGNRTPSSKHWDANVAIAYRLGVRTGSIPILERRKSGVAAVMRVGRAEWRIVACAMENGRVHESRV